MFPNPAKDLINIELQNENFQIDESSEIKAKLFNMIGEQKGFVSIKNNISSINTSSLIEGVYVLKIEINGEIENHRILIK